MARKTRGSNSERFKYGICLNDECQKCKDKEVQQIPMRKEFVCSKCGKELRECHHHHHPLWIIIVSAVVVVGAAVGGILALRQPHPEDPNNTADTVGKKSKDSMPEIHAPDATTITDDTVVVVDTVVQDNTTTINEKTSTKTVVNTTSTQAKSAGSGSLSVTRVDLGYAYFRGDVKNGKPHGNGEMTFKNRQLIPGTNNCIALQGETVVGTWRDGKINMGTWFRNNGDRLTVNYGSSM